MVEMNIEEAKKRERWNMSLESSGVWLFPALQLPALLQLHLKTVDKTFYKTKQKV